VPALRVEIVAQARHSSRAVPGTGIILTGPGRAWTMLFRAVPGLVHRVSAKWPSIGDSGVHAARMSIPCYDRSGRTLIPGNVNKAQHIYMASVLSFFICLYINNLENP
jgi:hypothetical protein